MNKEWIISIVSKHKKIAALAAKVFNKLPLNNKLMGGGKN